MALILEETLDDGRVMNYHRVAEFAFTTAPPVVRFMLESFETAEDRADPTVQPYRREWDFPFSGDGDPRSEAYRALLARSEWSEAVADDEEGPTPTPGDHEARPSGQFDWDSDAECWSDESLNIVAEAKMRQMIDRFQADEHEDLWSGGMHWLADTHMRHRLMMACAVIARAPDPGAVTREWWGEDWTGPHTLTGTQLLQMQADLDQRSQEAASHLDLKKQEILDAAELTPTSAAIAAINAIQWEFDAPLWGFPD